MSGAGGLAWRSVRRARAWPPLNWMVTGAARAALRATHLPAELAIKHLPRVGEVRCRLPNGRTLRLWSQGDDWVANQVFWRGWQGYEPETSGLFFRLAQSTSLVLDVGAHVGLYALLAAHANPRATVYAFEPLVETSARLRRNVALNGLTNVRCEMAAVGARDGTVDFLQPKGSPIPCSAGTCLEFLNLAASELIARPVRQVCLDRFLADRSLPVELVKIDTESTEAEVLEGMAGILAKDRPTIVCEVLPGAASAAPLQARLGAHGYRFYRLTPEGPRESPTIEPDPRFLNHLFSARPWGELSAA